MDNELKTIVDALSFYADGWLVTSAEMKEPGVWSLMIQKAQKEAENDSDE